MKCRDVCENDVVLHCFKLTFWRKIGCIGPLRCFASFEFGKIVYRLILNLEVIFLFRQLRIIIGIHFNNNFFIIDCKLEFL